MAKTKRKLLGRHIVADPKICHGKPTFIGTRIMVFQILRQVAKGTAWSEICAMWDGKFTKEAIAEAVDLARQVFVDRTDGPAATAYKERTVLGHFIVADPKICHGQPTFIGSRVMVWQVLRRLAREEPWDSIAAQWPASVTKESIADAMDLARRLFEEEYSAKERLPA
jgi:uncharacterized protein (DUF433 family)